MTTTPDIARMKRELADLVAIRTENPPGREVEAAAFVAGLLAPAGFDLSSTEYQPGRVNVVARLENGPGSVFAFNTHMDVVPAGDGWSSDPFVLREEGGRLYGRGACDCKGPLVAMVEALRMLAGDRGAWSGTLLGVFVADEEIASAGAKHYAAGKPRIDFAVVGEPTSNATFAAHKGSLRPLVRVHGLSAHSGTRSSARTRSCAPGSCSGSSSGSTATSCATVATRSSATPASPSPASTAAMPTTCCQEPATSCSTAGWCRARTRGR